MGIYFQVYKVKGLSVNLNDRANNLREEARYEHGHGGYTGTIAEDNGQIKVINEVMNIREAQDYIMEHAEKWEHSLAIPLNEDRTEWLIGGIYSC